MKETRNCSVDIFRYIAAILIIALHTTAFLDISPIVSYLFSQILPRISAPFFFVIAGYYYSKKLENGSGNLLKYLKRLLIPYCVWSIGYYLAFLLQYHTISLKSILPDFLFRGPAYHFWFFPSLIYSVILFTALYRINLHHISIPFSLILYLFGCMCSAYYGIFQSNSLINAIAESGHFQWIINFLFCGPSFFICGYLIYKISAFWSSLSNNGILLLLSCAFILYLVEIFTLKSSNIAKNITITVGLYILVTALVIFLLRHPLPNQCHLASYCSTLANYTYYSHVLFIILFTQLNTSIFQNFLTETPLFLLVLISTVVTGSLLRKIPIVNTLLL